MSDILRFHGLLGGTVVGLAAGIDVHVYQDDAQTGPNNGPYLWAHLDVELGPIKIPINDRLIVANNQSRDFDLPNVSLPILGKVGLAAHIEVDDYSWTSSGGGPNNGTAKCNLIGKLVLHGPLGVSIPVQLASCPVTIPLSDELQKLSLTSLIGELPADHQAAIKSALERSAQLTPA